MNTAAPTTTALLTEPLFTTATQLHLRHLLQLTQRESVSSTARLELNQPIDSFDTADLKDFEQVNGGLDVLGSKLRTRDRRTSDGSMSCTVS